MPILLYGVGAVAFVIGLAAIGFGIPNNEFGIGNTLIVTGMTAATGGLIILALGVVVTQLQRIADALGTRAPVRTSRPFETFESAAAPPPPAFFRGRDTNADRRPADPAADRRPVDTGADREEHVAPPPPTRPPNAYFDAMWPAEPKSPDQKLPESRPAEQKLAGQKSAELQWPDARRSEQLPGKARTANKPPVADEPREAASAHGPDDYAEPSGHDAGAHAVAILKSGVVDGMGYTLYVDGSIEAELPQGTLRFASINELRGHLEKTM